MNIFKSLIILALIPLSLVVKGINTTMTTVDTAYSATSINVAIFRTNAVVTHDSIQYVSYYNADGYVTIAKRRLNESNWDVAVSQYRGNVNDAHNVISIMVDDYEIIHASFNHHGNKLNYCKSTGPGEITLGPLEPMIGVLEDDVTYPEFYRLDNGDILFAYRSGASGRGNLVLNRYDIKSRQWHRVHDSLIDGENQRNAYWQLYADNNGVLHLSWVWRETWMVETNHDLCYAKSLDGGSSWVKSDGTPYTLPIIADSAEIAWAIPQSSELINQTSMSTDDKGNPYIATYWREQQDSVPQYRLVWHDGTRWSQRCVSDRKTPFSLAGGGTKMIPIARPRVVIANDYIYYLTRDVERGSKASLYHGKLTDSILNITDLTDFSVNAWEPLIDTELWKRYHQLHVYIQNANQGDGEKTTQLSPQPIYILELK